MVIKFNAGKEFEKEFLANSMTHMMCRASLFI